MDDSLFDPITLNTMMQALPDIQQRQRRVQQLRAAQQQMTDLANTPGTGNYVPTQQGGLYPTVAQRQPDYAGAGNKIAGTIGALISQNAGNGAEDQYNATRNQQILRGIQQASGTGAPASGASSGASGAPGGDMPTGATMRAYLNLIGGPDMKDVIGQIPHVSSTKVGDNGNIINVMSDGSMRDTGMKADFKAKIQALANGDLVSVGQSGEGRGKATPLQMAGAQVNNQTGAQPQQNMPTGFDALDAQVAQREGGYTSDGTAKGTANFGINQAAHPEITNVKDLTAPQAQAIRKSQYWDAIGGDQLPPALQGAAYDAAIHMGVGKAQQLLQQSGGDPERFGQLRRDAYDQMFANGAINKDEYLSGIQRNVHSLQGGPTPVATTATGPNGNVTGTAVTGPNGNTAGVLRVLTPAEKAQQEAQAKAGVEIANAPALGAAKASSEAQADLAKKKSDLKLSVASQNQNTDKLLDQIQRLKNDPNLEKILAGSVMGGVTDDDLDSRVGTLVQTLNPQAANAIALYQQVRSNAALQGLQQFRGLGMRITQGEFNVDAKGQTVLSRKLNPDDFKAELDRLAKHVSDSRKIVNDNANSPTWRPDVRADTQGSDASAAAPAAPAGQMSDADLLKKYGLQ
jgi:hypothetical protein